MNELSLKRRVARVLLGLALMCLGSYVAWKSHDMGFGIFASRLLAGVGGMIAMYGFMWVLGSSALGFGMLVGGFGFFFWSLWTVFSGGTYMDIARIGLWCGPLCGVIGFVFVVPFGRSKTSKNKG